MPLDAGSGDITATTAVAAAAAGATVTHHYTLLLPQQAMTLFVALLAISGLTSSTFTLVFCYISDTVTHKDQRLSAYGLALATFGLSFTLGTLCGGYLAETGNPANVFRASCILAIFDLVYIAWILPESKQNLQLHHQEHKGTTSGDATSIASNGTAHFPLTDLVLGGNGETNLGSHFKWIRQPAVVKGSQYATRSPKDLLLALRAPP
jgi:MFS family permease